MGRVGERSERRGVGEGGIFLLRFLSGLTQALVTSLAVGESEGATSKSLLGSSSSKALWWGSRSLVMRLGRPVEGRDEESEVVGGWFVGRGR